MISEYVLPIPQKDLKDLFSTVMETTRILTVRDDAEAFVKRGMVLCKVGMYEEGMADLNKAMSISPFYALSQVGHATEEEYLKFIDNSQKFVQNWQELAKMCGINS